MPMAPLRTMPSGSLPAGCIVTIWQSTSRRSHMIWALGSPGCSVKAVSSWPNLSELLVGPGTAAPVGLLGAPLAAGSVTAGSCDQAPALLRRTLRRVGRYDVETGHEIDTMIADRGDITLDGLSIEQATAPIRAAVGESCIAHALTLL